jgi:predicted dehydrogenase
VTDRVRIGILGCSDIARRRFLPALRAADNARLAAVASRDPASARTFLPAARYAACSYDELIASEAVDLVYISLPNHLHEEWTLKALERGKHVICEKPLGLTRGSVERMVSLAEKRDLLLHENLAYLHHPQHARMTELLAAGTIGRVRAVRAAFGFSLKDRTGFRADPARGGGSFHDQACYPLSAALAFLGVQQHLFRGHSFFAGGLNVGMTACSVTAGGESFWFSIGFDQGYECWYEIVGERGSLRLDRAFTAPADLAASIEVRTGTARLRVAVPAADQFRLMLEHVCGSVLKGTGFSGSHEQARHVSELAESAWAGCEQVILQERERRQ